MFSVDESVSFNWPYTFQLEIAEPRTRVDIIVKIARILKACYIFFLFTVLNLI